MGRLDKESSGSKIFDTFLAHKKILVADPNGASRAGIARTLISMGAKTGDIDLAPGYHEAIELIKGRRPAFIITEYNFIEGSGLDFCKAMSDAGIEPRDSFFVILTNDSSQSSVAQAAEEEVDSYILKPYTIDSFKEKIIAAVTHKFTPSPYHDAIFEGKKLIRENKIDGAIQLFKDAVKLNSKPSLALAYLGQTLKLKSLQEEAEGIFKNGLEYNPIHFKCLMGLFDLLMERRKFNDAYLVLKALTDAFPPNPNRLSDMVRLIIITKNYQEIDQFYEAFKKIEYRSPALVKVCCAALITCGRFSLKSGEPERGVTLLTNASISAAGNPSLLKEVILILTEFGKFERATEVLKKFPIDQRKTHDYLIAEYMLVVREVEDPLHHIHFGRKLISEGIEDLLIFRTLITALVKVNKMDEAEDTVVKAAKIWPDQKDAFTTLLKG